MSYLVLARKFRPQGFSEVRGQQHVTKTLINAIKRDKVGHAYLFAGPRGVGKTSVARIFSKALNCTVGPTAEPCLQCSNCLEIAQGTNLAVREIDGASHNSVENVRELIESFRALPAPGSRYKIYIIDEVHMLSTAAFNALLKSLEEPPPHTIFILATTEAHKIPETVISRCQRHDFRALRQGDIEERLKQIAAQEGIDAELAALNMMARLAEGSMRDAESLLERVHAFCDGPVTAAETSQVLGVVERRVLFDLSSAILSGDAPAALKVVGDIFSTGVDPGLLLKEFVSHFRDLLVARCGAAEELRQMGLSNDEQQEVSLQVQGSRQQDILFLVRLACEGADLALRSAYPKFSLEALVVRMAAREEVRESLPQMLQVESARAAPEPETESSSARPVVQPEAALDWPGFVLKVVNSGVPMLAEQLKRLAVEKFNVGLLTASGPEFSVAYLKQAVHKEKLRSLLVSFSGCQNWRVELTGTGVAAPAASLAQKEEEERRASRREKKEDISNHPKIKSLQKVFPGSKIENIRIRE